MPRCIYTVGVDVRFSRFGQVFEWDSGKALRNLGKHGVSFESACEVFFDPFFRLLDASDRGEARDAVLGYAEEGALLFVVHMVRAGEIIRVISARPATPSERRVYENE